MGDERDYSIEVFINRWATSKIPRNAPRGAWRTFHENWKQEIVGARELAINVYRGFSFAPCFDGPKTKEHFTQAWHLALDFDCADERAHFDTLMEDDLINNHASFLYYTPSSKPPAYKSRVVFILDQPLTTVNDYERLVNAFAWRFPHSDQSATDAARFFYGSKDCELLANWSILPLASAWEIVKQYDEANPPRPLPTVKNYQPVAADQKEVSAALKSIPPKMDYSDWLGVCMAVHSSFPDSTGVSLLEAWSPGYEGEIADKFKSFERTSTNGITVRTLFKMAKDNGYRKANGSGGRTRKYDLRAVL